MRRISFIVRPGDSMGRVEVAQLYRFHRPARHNMIGSWTPITTSITPQGEIHEVKRTEQEQRRAFYAHQLDIEAAHE